MTWLTSCRPIVRVAGMFALRAEGFDHSYNAVTHAIHLHEYAGTIRIGGEAFRFEPGTFTLSPAGVNSSYDLPRPGVHWCVHFDPPPRKSAGPTVSLPLMRPLGPQLGEMVGRFAHVSRLHRAASQAGRDTALLADAASIALQELLVCVGLLGHGALPSPYRPDVVDQLIEYIDRHLSRRFTAEGLATQAGLSQNYLAGLFRKRTGQTVPGFILNRRIAAAELLLTTTDLPIKHIAIRVGLPDPHHFNKQFRRLIGTSPTAYRSRTQSPMPPRQ